MKSYVTLAAPSEAEVVEKRSRFLAVAAPVQTEEEALAFLESVRTRHRDARHHVHAFVLRDGTRRCSDDGEPRGTGGVPVLDVLLKNGLTDCILVVTRYFGGVLLGAPGLVRAYSAAAAEAVRKARRRTLVPHRLLELECDYALAPKLRIVAEERARVLDIGYSDKVRFELALKEESVANFIRTVRDLSAGRAEPRRGEEVFLEEI